MDALSTTGVDLDFHNVHSIHSHETILTFGSTHEREKEKTKNSSDNNAKTDIVVAIVCIVPVAIRRTTIDRIVVPRATPQSAVDLISSLATRLIAYR